MTESGAIPSSRRGGAEGPRRNEGHAGRAGRATMPGRGRRGPEPIAVTWDAEQRRPVAFVWRGRRYAVERLLEVWIVETGWWKDEGRVSRSCWRVRAAGRVFDLRYDRLRKAWALEQALS